MSVHCPGCGRDATEDYDVPGHYCRVCALRPARGCFFGLFVSCVLSWLLWRALVAVLHWGT